MLKRGDISATAGAMADAAWVTAMPRSKTAGGNIVLMEPAEWAMKRSRLAAASISPVN